MLDYVHVGLRWVCKCILVPRTTYPVLEPGHDVDYTKSVAFIVNVDDPDVVLEVYPHNRQLHFSPTTPYRWVGVVCFPRDLIRTRNGGLPMEQAMIIYQR